MGSVDLEFAESLRRDVGIGRAVETGTFRGITARALAGVFDLVVTIELFEPIHVAAKDALSDLTNVEALHGHSRDVLANLSSVEGPSLYFLDGHWSGGGTGGNDDQCPVLAELEAIGPGNANDVIIVDDARLFTATPPPPMDPAQWPTAMAVFDAVRTGRPEHLVTILNDQIVAVPPAGVAALNTYGQRVNRESRAVVLARTAAGMARDRMRRFRPSAAP